MRYPENIKKGGTIGFVAPSFGCNIDPYRTLFDSSLKMWESRGYKTLLGPNCYAGDGIGISSTPSSCGKELTDGYCSGESDVLISCGGGELMCETLEYVDFDRISEAGPKWYMGYSDNTNFTFTLTTMCDVASIYGPCAAGFGMRSLHKSYEDAWGIMSRENGVTAAGDTMSGTGILDDAGAPTAYEFSGYGMWERDLSSEEKALKDPLDPIEPTEKTVLHRYIGDGEPLSETTPEPERISMQGRLLGGCLDCLVTLCGTKFDRVRQFNRKYGSEGILWFLESCDLNVFAMRRAVWELEQAGWFECASGFLIGRPLQFGQEMFGLDQYRAVYDILSRHRVPILMDADVGHLSPMVPLITGSAATVNAAGNDWKIKMELK
ncbi:MAG: LD-carboxypeptidase [Lachnospiraceae bacterium]|nr:LD-carboxypeptidase [Lachnospiraceae bacterium]